jgi:hypothetical protein
MLLIFPRGRRIHHQAQSSLHVTELLGAMLLLSLIDVTGNLWPWMTLDGWMDGSDDERKKLHNHTSRPQRPLHIVMMVQKLHYDIVP